MWEYRGQNDCTRSTAVDWSKDEYRKVLAKITTAPFTSLDAGMQRFSEEKPAPTEPPEMIEGEEVDEDKKEDDGDRMESDSVARYFVRLPRGSKRRTTSSSQSPPGEGALEDEEEEETTSPLEGKGPAKETKEPRPKRLRQTILEGATELQRPLQAALDAGARVGPGVKALPTVKAKQKVLKKTISARGAEATRAAEAKKTAEAKKAAADPADMTSTRGQATPTKKTASATAGTAGPTGGDEASAIVPPVVEKEPVVTEEGGTTAAPLKEQRSKAARDPALHDEPVAPKGGVPSTDAVVHGDEVHESREPPLSTLSFTELHATLNDVHVAEVKRLTALVEEAAKKNRQLISIAKAREKALAEACEGYVKESFYREADFRVKEADAAA
ncbi:hypothetical protein QYE76_020994 [Lolium multiflorum]|uniref:Uncharacterized protein n=1 Tax=Lolium multiflorum TaxID=4521 RepID=A0AAD8R863_LOLMU|nr:hypothetical protein QYE76_020994 [Lolium multiflorum]